MVKPIEFYDIPSKLPGKSWSVNLWKTRYSLAFKGVPFETTWVEYPDIASVSKEKGFQPTSTGLISYTLPAIYDPNTSTALADSTLIAEYLDKAYPDAPKLLPPGSLALQHAFMAYVHEKIWTLAPFLMDYSAVLNPRSEEYFRRTRTQLFGKSLEDLFPKGEAKHADWASVKAVFDKIDGWLEKGKVDGPFFLGQERSYADIFLVSHLIYFKKVWGEDNELWKGLSSWHNGRWGNLVKEFEKYEVYT